MAVANTPQIDSAHVYNTLAVRIAQLELDNALLQAQISALQATVNTPSNPSEPAE